MALTGQTIPVYFSGGLDQKTAKQLVIPGKFLVLENCVRRKAGRIEKRFGFTELGNTVIGGGTITSGKRLAKLNDDLLLMNEDMAYSYSSANDAWVSKGPITSVLVESTPTIRNSDRQAMGDLAQDNGITVVVWEDSRTTSGTQSVRASIIDDATGAALVYDQVLENNASRPKVIAINEKFLILYLDSTGAIKCASVDSGNPTSVSASVTLDSGTFTTFDTDAYNTHGLFAASDGSQIKLAFFNSDCIIGSGANGLPTPTTIIEAAVDALTVVGDTANGRVYVAYKGSANNVKVAGYTASFLTTSIATVENIANVRNIGACINADDELHLFYEISAASPINHFIRHATAQFDNTTTTVTTAAAVFKRSVGLVTKPFLQDDDVYVNVTFETQFQPTYFTVRSDGRITSRMQTALGGGLTRDTAAAPALKTGICRVSTDTDGNRNFLLQVRLKLQAAEDGTLLSTARGLNTTKLIFGGSNLFSEQLGQNLHIAGGTLLAYDGVTAVEHGFHVYPENTTSVASNSTGTILNGTYYIEAIYEWIDGKGQIHRSAPSFVEQVVMAGANDTITVTVPTLRLTEKTGTRANVKVVVYRTLAGQIDVLYRDNETTNDPTVDTVDVVLTRADTSLALQEVLYTVGGVLENTPAPACKVAVKHKNRMFLGGLEDPYSLAYSREHVFGEGVSFSDGLLIPVEPAGGGITALASLDDKLVIFKRDRVYSLVGDGPVDTGALDDYTRPQLITGDVGAIDQASIVTTPGGIMFKSDKGIYLLTRSLGYEYVGAGVEDFNNLTISSGTLLEDVNEVRFTTSDGQALIYNYFFDQWSTFTNYTSVAGINALGAYVHLRSDGSTRKESAAYLDAGGRIKMAIETSWLAFAGIQGFQRIWEYALFGDFLTDHYTRIKLAYDYEDVYNETVYFNTDEGLDLSYYGDDATYGDSTVYGGEGSTVYQFSSTPRRQKCEAIKFRIEDIDTKTPAGGGSFTLVGLTIEAGVKKGINKMRGAKTIGSLNG